MLTILLKTETFKFEKINYLPRSSIPLLSLGLKVFFFNDPTKVKVDSSGKIETVSAERRRSREAALSLVFK